MTKERINEYSLRIAQTNRSGLVVVIYEIILEYLRDAEEDLQNENLDSFVFHIKKARQFVNELSSTLDFHFEISFELMNLYMFATQCLVSSEVKRRDVNLKTVRSMITKLKTAFEEVSKTDYSEPVIKGNQKVYEGLTYGRDAKNNINVSGRNY